MLLDLRRRATLLHNLRTLPIPNLTLLNRPTLRKLSPILPLPHAILTALRS